jgi:hypothetical protein
MLLNNQLKEAITGRASSTHEREEKCMKVSVGNPEAKRPPGRHRCRWEDYVKTGWEVLDMVCLAQDRGQQQALVNMVMNF